MPSINDNITLKDGNSDDYFLRAMDRSAAQDGSVQVVRKLAEAVPVDYSTGGCFRLVSKSGIMAAGLAANSPIYAFRWTSTTHLALLRKLRLKAWSLGTGFAAGLALFDLFRVQSWTIADTGGTTDTLSGDNGNLRAAMPASLLSELRHSATATLTAGTRTKNTQPFGFDIAQVTNAANTIFADLPLFGRIDSEHPLVMAQNEGFVIEATVPATGTWTWAITAEWDEVPITHY